MHLHYLFIFIFLTACQTFLIKEDYSVRFFQGQARVSQDANRFFLSIDVYLNVNHPNLRIDVTSLFGDTLLTALWTEKNYIFIFPNEKTYFTTSRKPSTLNKNLGWIFNYSSCLYKILLHPPKINTFSTNDNQLQSKDVLRECPVKDATIVWKKNWPWSPHIQFTFENKKGELAISLKQKRVDKNIPANKWFDIAIPSSFKKIKRLNLAIPKKQ